jgi:hypothetical protein
MGDQPRQQMQDMTQQAKDAAGNLMNQARTQVKTQLSSQKEKAAESLGSVAEAIRSTGNQLREQDQQVPVGRYAEQAAGMVDQVAEYLRTREIDEMVGQVEDLARRQPAVFLGTAFAIGFMAARFLKSTRPAGNGNGAQGGYSALRHGDFDAPYYRERESIREAELHEQQGYPVKSVYERSLERSAQGASPTYGTMPEGYSGTTPTMGGATDVTTVMATETYSADLDDDEQSTDYSTTGYGTRSGDV